VRRGLGCDDAYGYALWGDFVAAVVADGAGSVTGTSAWGSYAACQSILRGVMTRGFVRGLRTASPADADDIMRFLFDSALSGVTRQAEAVGVPVAQLATTLCVAVSTPKLTVFGQIGDGIIASEKDGVIATHLIEEKSEYANATWFLQSDGAFEESFRTSAHTGLTAFALSTDGMTYKITNIVTGEAYEPFFTGSWQNVRSGVSAADFAAALRGIKDDQTGDDKTMVLAARRWVDDAFYPSARPVCQTIVSSPPPAPIPRAAQAAKQEAVPARARTPDGDSRSIVDHGTLVNVGGITEPLVSEADRMGRADAPTVGNVPQDVLAGPGKEQRRGRRLRYRHG
jgi:hypothetical protein